MAQPWGHLAPGGCPSPQPVLAEAGGGGDTLASVCDSPVSRLQLALSTFREASCLTTHV